MNKSESFWDKTANTYDQLEKKDEQTYINYLPRELSVIGASPLIIGYLGWIMVKRSKSITEFFNNRAL